MERGVTRRRAVLGIGTLVGGVSLAGCTNGRGEGGDGGDDGRRTVEMTDNLVFDPAELEIGVDVTVIWKNARSVVMGQISAEHTVTAYEDDIPEDATYFASGSIDSEQAARNAFPEGAIGGGETYQHTFKTTGTYEYFCIPHEVVAMTVTIKVT